MTADQLEELLGKVTQGAWRAVKWDGGEWPEKRWSVSTGEGCAVCVSPRYADHTDLADATLIALSPSLARRALAAEKLVEALREIAGMDVMGASAVAFNALTAYREASK